MWIPVQVKFQAEDQEIIVIGRREVEWDLNIDEVWAEDARDENGNAVEITQEMEDELRDNYEEIEREEW